MDMHEHPTQVFPETHWKRYATESICAPPRRAAVVHVGEPSAPLETRIAPQLTEELGEGNYEAREGSVFTTEHTEALKGLKPSP
jgi:hypothetical protein